MNIEKLIEEYQNIQVKLLDFLDNDSDNEMNYQDLTLLFNDQKIQDDKQNLILLLSLLVSISNNHYRTPNFWAKIEKILLFFKGAIKKLYSNKEIFKIFNKNKRILLFIIKEQILTFDLDIAKLFISKNYMRLNYIHFFSFEIKPFKNELHNIIDNYEKIHEQENSYKKRIKEFYSPNFSIGFNNTVFSEILEEKYSEEYRKNGENESEICELIRKDSIKDFIVYINKNNLSLKSTIKPSIYETNSFLINKNLSLLEYAVFNGSIQIYNYLRLNNVELTPSLWNYAIHGNNSEIIHSLEENNIIPKSYKKLFIESIKCHHNDLATYIQQNYLENNDIDNNGTDSDDDNIDNIANIDNMDNMDNIDFDDFNDVDNDDTDLFLKYYNFQFMKKEYFDENSIIGLLSYNYTSFFCSRLQEKCIDINRKIFKNVRFEKSDRKIIIYRKEYEKTSLYIAVENENVDIVKLLLNNDNLDINDRCEVFNSFYENEQCYIDAPPNKSLRTLKTAFYAAVEKENIEIIELFFSNPRIDINIPCIKTLIKTGINEKYERTPLYEAVKIGNIDIIKLLLKNDKIDINIINKKLHKNIFIDGTEICTHFKSKEIEKTALYKAIEKENVEIIKLLLQNDKLNINIPYIEEILNTKQSIDDDTVFLEKEERKTKEITSLFTAVQRGNIEIIKLLLENENLNINFLNRYREDYYPHQMNVRYDKIKMISYAETALYEAVDKKKIDVVKLLLSFDKININSLNKDGNQVLTSMHKAVQKNCLEIVKILLANKNIDISIKDDKGKTPVYYANNEIKKLLDH